MPRWVIAAAVLTLAVAFPATPARAGLFSHHHGPDCGVPTCAAPVGCAPSCAAPIACEPSCCAPVAPTCAVPVYDGCGEVYCDGCYDECEKECCIRRAFKKLASLERRKNRCLKDLFCGHDDDCCYEECAPVEYYQPSCGAPVYPSCGAPAGCY